jgi:hypothetical protein
MPYLHHPSFDAGEVDTYHLNIWKETTEDYGVISHWTIYWAATCNILHIQKQDASKCQIREYEKNVNLLHKQLKESNVYAQLQEVLDSTQSGLLCTQVLKFEILDNKITTAMKEAEKRCRKLKTGMVQWSPLYQKACDRVTYWTLLKKESQGKRVNARIIASLRNKLGYQRESHTQEGVN